MERLIVNTHNRWDTFEFDINNLRRHQEPGLCNKPRIRIEFKNKKFYKAVFPFENPYSQLEWEVLGAINAKIEELEEFLK